MYTYKYNYIRTYHLISADALQTMRYALQTMRYALQTMRYALQTMRYALQTMRYALQTMRYALQTMRYERPAENLIRQHLCISLSQNYFYCKEYVILCYVYVTDSKRYNIHRNEQHNKEIV